MTQKQMETMAAAMRKAGFSASEVMSALSGMKVSAASKDASEKVTFTKKDGTTRECSKKQAANWERARNDAEERKATYNARREAFVKGKCPKALEDAIRKDRAAVTAKVARSLGFVGTKQDLKDLKAQVLGK